MRVVQTLIRGHQSGRKDEGASIGILIGGPSIGLGLSLLITNTKVIGYDLGKSESSSRDSLDTRGVVKVWYQSGII